MVILPLRLAHIISFEVKNNIALTVTVCIALFEVIGEVQKERLHYSTYIAGMDECMDTSCKQRAEYFHRSLIIIHTERCLWQGSFIGEKSAYLAEVSVTEQILQISRNPGGTEHAQTVCTRVFFSAHTQEPGTEARLQRVLFLSQVLGSRAAEKETWSESSVFGGHFQVSLMEAVCAGSIASR